MAHAYLSPELTIAFYRWKLGRKDFLPVGVWWGWDEFPSARIRTGLWLMFVLLLLLPRGRLWGLGGLLLLVLVPKSMIGFTRYQPWLWSLGCLAAVLSAEWAERRLDTRLSRGLSIAIIVLLGATIIESGHRFSPRIECKARERDLIRERIRAPFWAVLIEYRKNCIPFVEHFVPRYNYLTCNENRVRLLVKEQECVNTTIVESADEIARALGWNENWDERNWSLDTSSSKTASTEQVNTTSDLPTGSSPASDIHSSEWTFAPFGYWVPVDGKASHVFVYYDLSKRQATFDKDGAQKIKQSLHAWLSIYPREIWRRLWSC